MATVVADAVSYLLSAAGLVAIGRREPAPVHTRVTRSRARDVLDGWRYILAHPELRALFFNTILVSGLITATAPQMAVLMLGRLGFTPWEYGLAFGAPCAGGLLGARLARPLAARFGRDRILRVAGVSRACWSVGLVFVGPGPAGLLVVIVVQLGLVTCMGVFNPVFAAQRLHQTPSDRVSRTLTAWSISGNLTIAALTALGGWLSSATSPRTTVATAGVLLVLTVLLLLVRRGVSPGWGTSAVEDLDPGPAGTQPHPS